MLNLVGDVCGAVWLFPFQARAPVRRQMRVTLRVAGNDVDENQRQKGENENARDDQRRQRRAQRSRKPRPGMLREVAQRYSTDLKDVPAVGDSLRDPQAAAAVGAQPILVLTGKGARTREHPDLPRGTLVFPDLAAAAAHIAA